MEWNGMGWDGVEWNGMERNGMQCNGMEWNGMEWKGIKWCAWNETGWNPLLKICAGSSQIGARGLPKSVPRAPRGVQSGFQNRFEQQVELPWPIWATTGTL